MATSLTSNIAHGTTPYYTAVIQDFIEAVNSVTGFKQDFIGKSVPLGSGTRAQFTQMVNLAKVTAKLTDEVTNPTAKAAKVRLLYATPDLWGDTVEVSQLAQDTTPGGNFEQEIVRRLGDQAGRSLHTQLGSVLTGVSIADDVAGAVHLIAGGGLGTTEALKSINDGVAANDASNSTTVYVYDSLLSSSGTASAWTAAWAKGGYIVFTDPSTQNYGLARKIKGANARDASTGIIDWTTAINVAVATGEKALICGLRSHDNTALTSGTHVLKAVDLRRAVRVVRRGKANKFGDGYFHGGFDPDDVFAMQNEGAGSASTAGTFADVFKYTSSAPYTTADEQIIMFGAKMRYMTEPHTLNSTAGVYDLNTSDAGAYHCSYIVGAGAAGFVGFANRMDTAIKITRPGSQTTNDALGLKDVLGWLTSFAKLPINAQQSCVLVGYPAAIQ